MILLNGKGTHMPGTKVGVRELKSRLSAYLSLIKAGQTVVITERGKVIGYLSPAAPPLEARMRALEAAGFLRCGKGKLQPHEPIIVNPGPEQVSDLIVQDRR